MKKISKAFIYQSYNIHYKIVTHDEIKPGIGILYLHGKNSHSDYLDKIIDKEKMHQYSFFAFDYPGQGRSSGIRGNCNIYKILPGLIKFFIENIIYTYGIKQLFIFGESLGALVAFNFVSLYQVKDIKIAGIAFIPGVYKIKAFSKQLKIIMLYILRIVMPLLAFKNKTTFSFYTNDPKKIEELEKDQYYGKKVTARFLYNLYQYFKYFKKNFQTLNIPIIIFHGKDDHYSSYDDLLFYYNQLKKSDLNKIVLLDKSNHWLFINDEIELIKKELYNWIERI